MAHLVHRVFGPLLRELGPPALHVVVVELRRQLGPEAGGLRQHGGDDAVAHALDQVPDQRLADAITQHHEFLRAEMIHQADMVVGEGVPRALDIERAGRLAAIGVAQVGDDAAELVAEFLHRAERMCLVEAADRRVQPAARNDQQRQTRARLFIVNANVAFFVERHGCFLPTASVPRVASGRKDETGGRAVRQQASVPICDPAFRRADAAARGEDEAFGADQAGLRRDRPQ